MLRPAPVHVLVVLDREVVVRRVTQAEFESATFGFGENASGSRGPLQCAREGRPNREEPLDTWSGFVAQLIESGCHRPR